MMEISAPTILIAPPLDEPEVPAAVERAGANALVVGEPWDADAIRELIRERLR
jgi:hypothetical protein